MTRLAGAVLIGGSSRRMGVDKAALEVGGMPMALRVAQALREVTDDVMAVGPPAEYLREAGVRTVADDHPGEGPLGGILTAMRSTTAGHLLVVACDLPSITPSALRHLASTLTADPSADIAVAVADVPDVGRRSEEPLCAAWRVARCAPALAAAFDGGERAVHRAWAGLARVPVRVAGEVLLNVNAPTDVPSSHGNS